MKGRRKTSRPLSKRRPIHFVLKLKRHDLFKQRKILESELTKLSQRFGLSLYGIAVNFDHVHFIAKIPARSAYNAFIRALTANLARKIGKGLWSLLPFSRILSWGRDYQQVKNYLKKNREEVTGDRPYEPRQDLYRRWRVADV